MINYLAVDLIENSQRRLQTLGVQTADEARQAGESIIGFSDAVAQESQSLKRFLRQELYAHFRVRRMTLKAGKIIEAMFQAFMDDPRLLPPQDQDKLREPGDAAARARIVADYIAGMTDRYAIREHKRLFDPEELT
jgi:dGTPase